MKHLRVILPAIVLIFLAMGNHSSYAQDRGAFGAGVVLGSPVGPTVKYWFNRNTALAFGLGFDDDFVIYSDVLWHGWKIFPQPPKGKLAGYLGLGLRFEDKEKDNEFGFRTVAGVSYRIPTAPIEVFLELVPVFQVSPDTDADMDAGIGLRYYFTGL